MTIKVSKLQVFNQICCLIALTVIHNVTLWPSCTQGIRTVLSSPSVIIITKKMIAKKVEPIMFAMASGYVMKSKLGPESMNILKMRRLGRVFDFYHWVVVVFFSFHDFKYKMNSLTFVPGNILNLHLPHLCHVAQHREDDEPRHEAGQTVHQTGHNGVTVEEEIQPCLRTCSLIIISHWHSSFNLIFNFY